MTSRLSAKGQVTIPKQVRDGIGLRPGDQIAYELHDGVAILRKAEPFDAEYHLLGLLAPIEVAHVNRAKLW